MPKAKKAKRTQSAAQKRAQRDLAAFVAANGRRPAKGESVKGYSGNGSPTARKTGKKRRKAKPKPAHVKAWRWVKKNPLKALAGAAGTAALTVPVSREALKGAGSRVVAYVRK
jgi:hypothetical protein